MYNRFRRLDKEEYGTIGSDAFLSIPELSMNPLIMRLIRVFDTNGDDSINFRQFVTVLSAFKKDSPPQKKIECKNF